MKISKERLCVLQCRSGLTGAQVAAKAGLKPQSYSAVDRFTKYIPGRE